MLRQRSAGVTLIELMVSVSVLAIMAAVAMPNFTSWISNARARTVADAVQSGLRLAQAQAQQSTRTVVFFLTNSKTCSLTDTAASAGAYWQIRTVPNALLTGDAAQVIQCGVLNDVSTGVTLSAYVTGSSTANPALCFGSDGRQASATNPTNIGVDCAAGAATYDITPPGNSADKRPLRVNVSLAGSVRMCDPNKSSTAPDGCR